MVYIRECGCMLDGCSLVWSVAIVYGENGFLIFCKGTAILTFTPPDELNLVNTDGFMVLDGYMRQCRMFFGNKDSNMADRHIGIFVIVCVCRCLRRYRRGHAPALLGGWRGGYECVWVSSVSAGARPHPTFAGLSVLRRSRARR